MNREELIKGLSTLNDPDQGMNYFGGGYHRSDTRYCSRTGDEITPRYRAASLTVHGDRARFLYRLIENADAVIALLPAAPDADASQAQDGYEAEGGVKQDPSPPEKA